MHTTLRSIRPLLALALVAVLSACWTAVDSTEHCVETRYGEVVNPKMDNGLTTTVTTSSTCFPLVDQNYSETFEAQTSDPVTVTGEFAVVIAYRNITKVFTDKRTADAAFNYTIDAVREAIGATTTSSKISDLFGAGRGTYGDSVKARAQRKLGEDILIKQVFIRNLHAPKAIEEARIAAAQKDQVLDAARKQLQIDSAQALGSRIKAEATAFEQRVMAEAMQQSPEVLKLRIAEATANGLKGACAGAATCIIGGTVMDKFFAGVVNK
jgi:hypothetical protein